MNCKKCQQPIGPDEPVIHGARQRGELVEYHARCLPGKSFRETTSLGDQTPATVVKERELR